MGVKGTGAAAKVRTSPRGGCGQCDLVRCAPGGAAARVAVPGDQGRHPLGPVHGTGRNVCASREGAVEHPAQATFPDVVPPHAVPRTGHLLAPSAAPHTRPALAAAVRRAGWETRSGHGGRARRVSLRVGSTSMRGRHVTLHGGAGGAGWGSRELRLSTCAADDGAR